MCSLKSVLCLALSLSVVCADVSHLAKGLPQEAVPYPASATSGTSSADVQQYVTAAEANQGYAAAVPSGQVIIIVKLSAQNSKQSFLVLYLKSNVFFFCICQAIDTAVYDPNTAYAYASPDAIQQYVSAGLIPYNGGIPVYPNPGAYAVQSGYEGYLVPSYPAPIGPPPVPAPFLVPGPGPFDFLRDAMPSSRTVFGIIGRLSRWLMGGLGAVLAGGALTTSICTFTPLCSITFALPFLALRDTAKKLSTAIEINGDTVDRVRRAADFVQVALEKYNKMQEEAVGEKVVADAKPVAVAETN